MIYTSNHPLGFYAGPKQCKGHLHQKLLFFLAYFIYYNFFTVEIEIKS
jgi:hypothetical protein